MGFTALVALIGLVFGMISIKMMATLEGAQVIVVRKSSHIRIHSRKVLEVHKIVTFAMSAQKVLFLRIGINFFARISSLIFAAEAMYPEKVVESAAFAIMKTVVVSNRIRTITVTHSKHALNKVKTRYYRNSRTRAVN